MHGNLDASQVNEIYGALYYGVYRNYFQGMQFLPSEELYFTYDFPQLFESHNKAAFISSWQHEKKNQLTEMVFFFGTVVSVCFGCVASIVLSTNVVFDWQSTQVFPYINNGSEHSEKEVLVVLATVTSTTDLIDMHFVAPRIHHFFFCQWLFLLF